MAYPDDLLEQAHHLATRERTRPRQASLRRAISTAYYALFHLLIDEAVSKWKVTAQRKQLARIFEHARMKAASDRILNPRQFPFTAQDPRKVAHLRTIAANFSRVYEDRQIADYDNATQWARTDVLMRIELVEDAFRSMNVIRDETITHDYLLSLFMKDRK